MSNYLITYSDGTKTIVEASSRNEAILKAGAQRVVSCVLQPA